MVEVLEPAVDQSNTLVFGAGTRDTFTVMPVGESWTADREAPTYVGSTSLPDASSGRRFHGRNLRIQQFEFRVMP
jgi:hypothetical protein